MTNQEYKSRCEQRWWGVALQDALCNWEDWEGMREYLTDAMRQFTRNPFMTDLSGKCHNPTGYLTEFLWQCQAAIQPDRTKLNPFLDFEERYQKIFLRRGLVIYCTAILNEIRNQSKTETPLFSEPTEQGGDEE